MLRKGHTTRIHDFGPYEFQGRSLRFVISCVGEWWSNGHHKWPTVNIYVSYRRPRKDMTNWSASCTHVETGRWIKIPLPYMKWDYRKPVRNFVSRKLDSLYTWAFVTTYRKQVERMGTDD